MDNNNLSPQPVEQAPITMDFYAALREVAAGKTIRRQSWPVEDFALMADFLLTVHTKGETKHWVINDGDLAGTDWITL